MKLLIKAKLHAVNCRVSNWRNVRRWRHAGSQQQPQPSLLLAAAAAADGGGGGTTPQADNPLTHETRGLSRWSAVRTPASFANGHAGDKTGSPSLPSMHGIRVCDVTEGAIDGLLVATDRPVSTPLFADANKDGYFCRTMHRGIQHTVLQRAFQQEQIIRNTMYDEPHAVDNLQRRYKLLAKPDMSTLISFVLIDVVHPCIYLMRAMLRERGGGQPFAIFYRKTDY
jgi:hypothetical protein